MQALLAGEGAAGLGDAAVGDQDDDIGFVDGAACAVEDLQFGCADGCALVAVPAVLALDDPAPAEGVGGLHVRAEVALAADLDGVRAAVAVH